MQHFLPVTPHYQKTISEFAALLDLQPERNLGRIVSYDSALGSILASIVCLDPWNVADTIEAYVDFPRFTLPKLTSEFLTKARYALCDMEVEVLGNKSLAAYIAELEYHRRTVAIHTPKIWQIAEQRRVTIFDFIEHQVYPNTSGPVTERDYNRVAMGLYEARTKTYRPQTEEEAEAWSHDRLDSCAPRATEKETKRLGFTSFGRCKARETRPVWAQNGDGGLVQHVLGNDTIKIFRLHNAGESVKDIATKLNMKPDTVSRCIRRGLGPKLKQRGMVALLYWQRNMSTPEIAEELQMSVGAIEQLIHRLQGEGEITL